MRATKPFLQVLAFLALEGAVNLGASAAEPAPGQTNAPPMAAEFRHEEGPGQLPADRVYISLGTNRFCFLRPSALKLETSNERAVSLVAGDLGYRITFRLARFQPPATRQLDPAFCQAGLLEEFPAARIVQSFAAFADSHAGVGFEVEMPGPAHSWCRARIDFIPSRAGLLEFSLSGAPEKF